EALGRQRGGVLRADGAQDCKPPGTAKPRLFPRSPGSIVERRILGRVSAAAQDRERRGSTYNPDRSRTAPPGTVARGRGTPVASRAGNGESGQPGQTFDVRPRREPPRAPRVAPSRSRARRRARMSGLDQPLLIANSNYHV